MKKLLSVLLVLSVFAGIFSLSGCSDTMAHIDAEKLIGNYDVEELRGTQMNFYTWGEYISDGSEGLPDVVADFERITGIKVNATTYASNEDLYAKLKAGGASYDVIVPSDYMIERMILEGLLQKPNFENIPNYRFISDEYLDLFFDPSNEYSIPYTGGMVGLIYNTTRVTEAPDSWSVLWDKTYAGDMLTFNNPRDAFGIAQCLLGQSLNTTNPNDWYAAAEKLKEQKPLLQSYVMDEVFDKMEGGEAAIAPYYAGDYLAMAAVNPDLAFVYPKEGTNVFVDSMCIPVGAKNKAAAELFINYMCEPEVALANAEYLRYLCPNTAVLEDERYTLKGNPILYPTADFKTEYFHNLDQDTLDLMSKLWNEVKLA